MGNKSNVRSFRFSDEVAAILEGMQGHSMNDNFEQLVLECYYKLPDLKKEIKYYEKQINQQRKKLNDMLYQIEPKLSEIKTSSGQLFDRMVSLSNTIARVTQSAGGCVDRASENV